MVLDVQVPKKCAATRTDNKYDISGLQDPSTATLFGDVFNEYMSRTVPVVVENALEKVDVLYERMVHGFNHAASTILPKQVLKPQRPWITASTLQLLERRKAARGVGDYVEEKLLATMIKHSVKRDRAAWLDTLTATGDWNEIRFIRFIRFIYRSSQI